MLGQGSGQERSLHPDSHTLTLDPCSLICAAAPLRCEQEAKAYTITSTTHLSSDHDPPSMGSAGILPPRGNQPLPRADTR